MLDVLLPWCRAIIQTRESQRDEDMSHRFCAWDARVMISLCNKLSDLQNESWDGGNESGKRRGRDVEGMGIRPLEGGRKDVLWNYLRFLNPLLSTLRHVAKPRFSPSRWEIHPTYVLLLTDILYVLAITDVWYALFKPALLVSWYNHWNYLNRKKEQVCSMIYDGFVSK